MLCASRLLSFYPGFGKSLSFDEDRDIPPGHSMTFKDAMHIVSTDITMGIVIPDWAKKLTNRMRKYTEAFRNLRVKDNIFIFITIYLHTPRATWRK